MFLIMDYTEIITIVEKYFSSSGILIIVDKSLYEREHLSQYILNANYRDLLTTDLYNRKIQLPSLHLEKFEEIVDSVICIDKKLSRDIEVVDIINDKIIANIEEQNNVDLPKDIILSSSFILKEPDISLKKKLTLLLHSIGMPSHIKGYKYIIDAILLLYNNPGMRGVITSKLYAQVACKYETKSCCVERTMRHAIEISWCRGDYQIIESIFGHSIDPCKAKPTNTEYIVTIADKLLYETPK